jgi:glycosyltransferase involved in cell wall biosynthesis
MRILRSIRSVNPEDGGPIEGIKQVSRVHQDAGHRVEIVSLDAPEDPWVSNCPLKVHALGPVSSKFGYNPMLVPWLRHHAHHYNAVIVNGIWQYNSLAVFRALRLGKTPYYVFPHGMLDPWFKRAYPLKHLKKWLYWPWAEYLVLRNANAVCFTCEEERQLARQSFWLYRCNERVVAYGTAAPTGDPESQTKLFYQRFPETQGKRLILFLGRIHPKKGCDLLIQGFHDVLGNLRTLAHDAETLHLVMAGPDQTGWSPELKRLTKDLRIDHQVTWTGMLDGDLKFGALHAAEVFILPSHQENFGIAAAEALACSLPVLISDKVNIWREVEKDRAGLVETDDLAGTRLLLQKWISLNPSERNAYRVRARRCFSEQFEITKAANDLLDLLCEATIPSGALVPAAARRSINS